MIKSALTIFLILMTVGHTYAIDTFEEYKQKENAEFQAYTEKMDQKWKSYLADIKKNFGSIDLTSDKKWVNYSKNKTSRVTLDYDKGIMIIEFIADDRGREAGRREAMKLIKEKSKEINPFSKAPTITENADLGKLKLKEAKPLLHRLQGDKKVYQINVPLNEDRQENNEVQIAESVRDMTFKYKVSYDLVMAIIKTESNFNIEAMSKKETLDIRNPDIYENNPWGLMQVVPKRSGKEGLKKARGIDRLPSSDELLDPRINLEIGVAYLSLLQYRYFDGVKNNRSRELIMISAYREGPEKVYGIFSTQGNKKEALDQINRLKSKEVADWLSGKSMGKTAPKSHMGKYVKKVEKERSNYRVEDKEREELEKAAKKIVKNPELMATIKEWLGTPYRYGSNSKKAIDCSAFTMQVYSLAYKQKIPRTSNQQYTHYGRSSVMNKDRKEGDLIYFKTLNNGNPVTHVGVWLDKNRFVHASSSKGVVISNLSNSNYWSKRYVGANRPAKGI